MNCVLVYLYGTELIKLYQEVTLFHAQPHFLQNETCVSRLNQGNVGFRLTNKKHIDSEVKCSVSNLIPP